MSPSQFTHEAEGLRMVRELLPDVEPFRAWSNFWFRDTHGRWNEVDLLVLGRDKLYLIELKYYSGTLRGNDYRWQRGGGHAEDSPLLLTYRKAQQLKTVLMERFRDHLAEHGGPPSKAREIVPWVQEAVFLHHPSFRCELPTHCRTGLYGLDGHEDSSGLPPVSELVLAPARGEPVSGKNSALLAGLMAKIGLVPRRQHEVGSYVIDGQPLASGDDWQDWPAFHRVTTTDRFRIRFYMPNPDGSSADESELRRRVDYEYRLLSRLHHDGLAVPRDLVQAELGTGLVYPADERVRRLDLWLADHGGALPLEAQLDLVRQLAEAVSYAHRHRVVHRGLAPAAVSVRERAGGGLAAAVANWDAAARVPGTANGSRATGLPEAEDSPAVLAVAEEAPLFEAPEGRWAADADRVRLDVFAVGALAFYVLANQTLPAQDRGALVERLRRDSGLDLAAELPQVSAGLRELVRQATHPRPAERTPGMGAFLQQLEEAEAALWAPTMPEDVDPLEARPGVVLGGRYTYQRTLGSGSTAVGILVTDTELGNAARVLKVAKDADAAERLAAEAAVLGPLDHERIATLIDHIELGGRHALVLQYAGEATLAEELARRRGRLSLDLLERWGTDLLDALVALDRAGVTHRDIKPGNLGVPTPGRGRTETHLMLFDFSMAGAGPRAIHAGTPRYLDPFLGQGGRTSYDSAAERYAAAVVLYEMATGELPVYGDDPDANPAAVTDELTIPPGAFDDSLAGELVGFFRAALAREVAARHDTAEDMRREWRAAFARLGRRGEDTEARLAAATPESTLSEAGLSARAVSALEPHDVHTVAELAALDSTQLNRLLVRETKSTREEIRKRRAAWRKQFGASRAARAGRGEEAGSIADPLAAAELLAEAARGTKPTGRQQAARLLLGLDAGLDAFAGQHELAAAVGRSAPRGHQLIRELQDAWAASTQARPLLDALLGVVLDALDTLGGVATVRTLTAEVLAALRDAPTDAAEQAERAAAGLLRVALDRYAEHVQAKDQAPLAKRRRDGRLVLLARSQVLLDAAEAAAARASDLVKAAAAADEPVVGQRRAAREVRERFEAAFRAGAETEAGPPAITDLRLVRLAAQAGRDVGLSTRGELHAGNLAAASALRLACSGLAQSGTECGPDELAQRVRARFPDADPLPARPDLDALVASAGIGLEYDPERGVYRAPGEGTESSGFPSRPPTIAPARTETSLGRGDHIARMLDASVATRSFLALGMPAPKAVEPARAAAALHERYGGALLDLTGMLIGEMKATAEATGLPWELVRAADAAAPGSRDDRGLRALVERALPAVTGRVDELVFGDGHGGRGPVILTEPSPLARYGHLNVIARWSDLGARRRRPVWLVLPQLSWMRGAVVDGKPLQLGSAGQFVELDAEWLGRERGELGMATANEGSA